MRRDLKSAVSTQTITDDQILELVTQSVSEEAERQKCLGPASKHKITVASAKEQSDQETAPTSQTQVEVKANGDAIHELSALVYCFHCGQAGHRVVECLMRSNQMLKGCKSLGRDHQGPGPPKTRFRKCGGIKEEMLHS